MRREEPRLGRGLAALLGEPQVAGGGGPTIRPLPIEKLEPGPFQPREAMSPQALDELTESIRSQGVLQPILVRTHPLHRDRYQIIAGERRWRASQAAGLHEIPALTRDLSDTEAMAAALVENLQRQDLNPIEEAEGYRRLLQEFGLTQEGLGSLLGKSRSHVTNTMRLLNLPGGVLTSLRQGQLSAGHARALLSHADPEKAARTVIERGLNVRQTEQLAGVPDKTALRRRRAKPDPDVAAAARELSRHLGLKVEIAFDGKAGHVRIACQNLDQLDGVIALLKR